LIKEGKCDRVVVKPYDLVHDYGDDDDSPPKMQSYVYNPPGAGSETVVVFDSITDVSFRFYGQEKRSFDESRSGWIIRNSDRHYVWEDTFERRGPAECKVPIS